MMKSSYDDIYSQIILVGNRKKKRLRDWLWSEVIATELQVMSALHANILAH